MSPKQRIAATLAGQPVDRIPVTPIFMAWAAHHIGKTYRDYYLDGDVLVDSQLAVAELLDIDQVSVISDPWREASGYGMQFDWPPEGVGMPKAHLIQNAADVANLRVLDPMAHPRMAQRVQSVARFTREVGDHLSIQGWVEGPIAEYVDLRDMQAAMMDLATEPQMYEDAAATLVATAIAFAAAQIDAGADIIGVGDAAASLVGPQLYADHVMPHEKRLFDAIHAAGAKVKLHICGNINAILPFIAQTGADIVDCDWMVPLADARKKLGENVTICGNFDPVSVLKDSSPQKVADAARQNIADAGERFILQPGCEVPPGTPIENLKAFCPCEGSLIAEALLR